MNDYMKIAAVKLNDQTCIRGLKSQINMAAQQKFCPPHNPSSPGDNHAVPHPREEQPGKPHFLGDQSRARARESVDMERGADEPTADLLSPSWRETSGRQLGLGPLARRCEWIPGSCEASSAPPANNCEQASRWRRKRLSADFEKQHEL